MELYDSRLYMQSVQRIAEQAYRWEELDHSSVAISGGTGMIGSFLVDVLMYRNEHFQADTQVYVLGRSEKKARGRFGRYYDKKAFHFVTVDINAPIMIDVSIDYVIHAASNTHPVAYAQDPIGTVTANVIGTNHLLDWASQMGSKRFVFLSSVEVYGENRGDVDYFTEDYMGYIDCNTLRAGYPESKRTGEALCQAYIRQRDLDSVIVRLSRVYGPSMLMSDTKAMSQFLLKGVRGEDIVLKSEGTQLYSYSYVADAVSAILYILLNGRCGAAYNVVSDASDVMLRDLAAIIADYTGGKVVFELPDAVESAGYSKATKAILDTSALHALGWESLYEMKDGVQQTIDILREVYSGETEAQQ